MLESSLEMMQDKRSESEGSEDPNPFFGKRDPFYGEELRPFKKRTRFLFIEVTSDDDDSESSGGRHNLYRRVPSMSSLTDAGEENKTAIPTTGATSVWHVAMSESGGSRDEGWGDVDEIQVKEITKDDVIEDTAGDSSSSSSDDTDTDVVEDAADESSESSGEEESKGRIIYRRRRPKQIPAAEEKPEKECDFCDLVTKSEDGGGGCSLTDTDGAFGKEETAPEDADADDCGGDAVPDVGGDACPPTEIKGDDEAAEEDAGGDGSGAACGEEPSKGDDECVMILDDGPCGEEKTAPEGEDGGGTGSFPPTNKSNNGGSGGEDALILEDDGDANNSNSAPGSEEQKEGGEKPLDDVVSTIGGENCSIVVEHEKEMHEGETQHSSICTAGSNDGGAIEGEQEQPDAMEDGGNENIANSQSGVEDQETDKGEEPAEGDDHEQGQQQKAATEDGRDGNSRDVIVSGEEDVPDGDEEQVHQPEQETNPEADADGDEDEQIPDDETGNKNADSDDTNMGVNMAIDEGDMETQQDPTPSIDGRKRSHEEVIEISDDEGGDDDDELARKKFKYGSDVGGSSSAAGLGDDHPPLVQQAYNRSFRFPIPCEKEPDDPINVLESGSDHAAAAAGGGDSAVMQQPRDGNGIRLFGVDISEEQVQPVAVRGIQLFGVYITGEQNGDGGGNSSHGDGQRARTGVRLFGIDIQ